MSATASALVTPEWLAAHLEDEDLRILDGSWYLPSDQRDPRMEYEAAHLPGARFFDVDAVADGASGLPHMLPTPEEFAAAASALGVGREHHVVVYDGAGLFCAPRVWWTFRVFGQERVSILDGGLPRWRAEGRPLTAATTHVTPERYEARLRPELARSLDEVRAVVEGGGATILDARSAGRFAGTTPETRAGLRSGHLPGSRNLPWTDLVTDGRLVGSADLSRAFGRVGVTDGSPVVTTCGSGVTACILALGLHELGWRDVAVYDGSWAEWGSHSDTPVETGLRD